MKESKVLLTLGKLINTKYGLPYYIEDCGTILRIISNAPYYQSIIALLGSLGFANTHNIGRQTKRYYKNDARIELSHSIDVNTYTIIDTSSYVAYIFDVLTRENILYTLSYSDMAGGQSVLTSRGDFVKFCQAINAESVLIAEKNLGFGLLRAKDNVTISLVHNNLNDYNYIEI